jgi:hypothetical protein
MQNFVPKEKLSKKAKRALNNARRTTWGALNPVTRKPQNPKAYDRKKPPRLRDDDPGTEAFHSTGA